MGRGRCPKGVKERKGCSCYHPRRKGLKGHDKGQTGRGRPWHIYEPTEANLEALRELQRGG